MWCVRHVSEFLEKLQSRGISKSSKVIIFCTVIFFLNLFLVGQRVYYDIFTTNDDNFLAKITPNFRTLIIFLPPTLIFVFVFLSKGLIIIYITYIRTNEGHSSRNDVTLRTKIGALVNNFSPNLSESWKFLLQKMSMKIGFEKFHYIMLSLTRTHVTV